RLRWPRHGAPALSRSGRLWNDEGLTETRNVTDAALTAVFREEAAKLTGAMVRLIGNFDIAEEVVQDSLVAALEKWPAQGIPDNPGAWLVTAERRGEYSLPGAAGRRAGASDRRRARGSLPDVQRGLPESRAAGGVAPRPRGRRDVAHQPGRAPAPRAGRSARADRADEAAPRALERALRHERRDRAASGPGPRAVGRGGGCPGGRGPGSGRRGVVSGPGPAAGGDRRGAFRGALLAGDRLGPDRGPLRHAASDHGHPGDQAQPRGRARPDERPAGPARRGPRPCAHARPFAPFPPH